MKRLWMVVTSAVVVVAGCASTQSPSVGVTPRSSVETEPQNTVEILRADDKVVTRVEKPNGVSPASQPVRVAQADTRTGTKMGNGWVITVYPKFQEAMIGRFVQPKPSPIKFEGHEKLVSRATPVTFSGEAIFTARSSGNHVFVLRIIEATSKVFAPNEEDVFASLSLNDEQILKINDKKNVDRNLWSGKTANATKAIKISEGEYNIGFEFGWRPGKGWDPNDYTLETRVIESGGNAPRHLKPDEIIHYRR
jgi:hypothetical protein